MVAVSGMGKTGGEDDDFNFGHLSLSLPEKLQSEDVQQTVGFVGSEL